MLFIQLIAVSYTNAAVSIGELKLVEGKLCPENYRHITIEEANIFKRKVCSSIQPSEIVWLDNQAAIGGVEHDCMIFTQNDDKPATPSASICQKPVVCDSESDLITAPGAYDFCAKKNDESGLDINTKDVCKESGKGQFKEYRYLFKERERYTGDERAKLICAIGEECKNDRPGKKTAICDQQEKPLRNLAGDIIACPFASELVKGLTVGDHCEYIWSQYVWGEYIDEGEGSYRLGKQGLDTRGKDLCESRGLGGFLKFEYRRERGVYNNDYYYHAPNGNVGIQVSTNKTLVCKKEKLPEIIDSKLKCPNNSKFIKGHSIPDHCTPNNGYVGNYIVPNNDGSYVYIDNDICTDYGKGYSYDYITDAAGTRVLVCSKETSSNIEKTKEAQARTSIVCHDGYEFIKSNAKHSQVKSHCAIPGEQSGRDSNGEDVCAAAGSLFDKYTYPWGVKTLNCQCIEGFYCDKRQDDSGPRRESRKN
ncbi:hypothetical protein [Zooshikella ganghwensis]|uniref:hypothetical protein n=1 Tax=Zooshikella ganghwensis TaxID=202772 RepID=UPI001058C109|nr:hypothetical protein [Zooshikella ganghwensis]